MKEEREGASTNTTPNPPPTASKPKPPPPPKKGKGGQSSRGKKEEEAVRVRLESGVRQPRLFLFVVLRRGHPPRIRNPPPKSKAIPAPKDKGREKKAEGGGKEAGRLKQEGGGGGSPRGTPAHVPYGGGVRVGTVTGGYTPVRAGLFG